MDREPAMRTGASPAKDVGSNGYGGRGARDPQPANDRRSDDQDFRELHLRPEGRAIPGQAKSVTADPETGEITSKSFTDVENGLPGSNYYTGNLTTEIRRLPDRYINRILERLVGKQRDR